MAQPLAERLRPKTLDDYIGQKHLVGPGAVLRKMIDAGRISSFILWGPPGVGKTTLAQIIANKLETPFYTLSAVTSGVKDVRDVIEKARSNRFFSQASPILFIDEIHRLDKKVEESLYSAMEDSKINVVIGQGEQCKSLTIDLPPITIIGATTRAGMLSAPLRDRFGLTCKMEYYSADELAHIGKITAGKLGVSIKDEEIYKIAEVSRGTPRVMNSNIKLIRDYVTANSIEDVTAEIVTSAMELYGIHDKGLTDIDIRILNTLAEAEKPVGLLTLSHVLGEDEGTIENVHEPYLLMNHYVEKTSRGRIITEKGKKIAYSLIA
mgnify:CR=1 FL=1